MTKAQLSKIPFFLILLILASASLRAEKIAAITDNSFEGEEYRILLTPDQFTETSEFIFKSSPALRGRVEISSSNRDEIEIIYHKVLYAGSREEAESFAGMISLEHEISGNSLILTATAPRDAPWRRSANLSGRIECEIYLPQRFSISMDLDGYYISVRGPFPEVDVVGEYCEEIRISRIDLGLKLNARNSLLTIRDVKGPTLIQNEGGSIKARNIDAGLGIATFECKRGELSITGFKGDELRCVSEDGKVNLEKISLVQGARAYISNSGINSDIYMDLEQLDNSRVEIINKAADVQLLFPKTAAAEFGITTDPDEGQIGIANLPLITDEVDWGRLKAHSLESNSRIVIDTRGTGRVIIQRKEF